METIRTFFSGNPIERYSKLRADSDDLSRAYRDPNTRFLPVWQSRCLVTEQRAVLLGKNALTTYTHGPEDVIFLGKLSGRFVFALALPDQAEPLTSEQAEFIEVRKLIGQLDETARFYMAARGVSPELARRLMVQAFLGDALVALDDDETRETLMQIALDKVDKAL